MTRIIISNIQWEESNTGLPGEVVISISDSDANNPFLIDDYVSDTLSDIYRHAVIDFDMKVMQGV